MSRATSTIDPTAAAAGRTNPFPGLRPFREDEESLFFGRESQVDAMVDKLAANHFLSVVGTSGSGKSSLVNCGLRPALRRGLMADVGTTWRMAQFRPGADPVRAMAGALAQDGVLFRSYKATGLTLAEIVETTLRMSKVGLIDIFEQARLGDGVNLLIVVDQFEELFRYRQLQEGGQDDAYGISEDAAAFVNLLLEPKVEAAHPIYAVLTMRSDFLGECARFPGLAEAVNDGQYLVPRLTRAERRAAIAGPIAVGGSEIEPVLLTRLLNDVGDNPDQLSILQHALNRTWARWREEDGKGPLRLRHYEAVGTMAHALDQHAERAFGELGTDGERKLCERIFKALTDKATDPRGVRRPTRVRTLCELTGAQEAEVAAVIEAYRKPSRSFLMPPVREALLPETVIDISHESLMRVWQRLDAWADEEAQSARTYRRLADAAAQYEAGEASLLRDPELQLALDWRNRNQPNESWASRYQPGFTSAVRFLADSEAARDKERRAARRRILSLIAVAVILAALLAISAALGVWAFHQKREADRQRRAAVNASKTATLLTLTGTASDRTVTSLSSALLFSLAAYRSSPSLVTRRSVVLSLEEAAQQPLQLILRTHVPAATLAVSPDGRTVATADRSGHVRRWDLLTHRRVGPTLAVVDAGSHTSTNNPSLAFAPNGRTLAEGTDARLTLWDLATGRAVSLRDRKKHMRGQVRTVAFSADGKTLASAGFDGHVRLWDVKTRQLLARTNASSVPALAFSPDNRTIASGGVDTVFLRDVRTGLLIEPLRLGTTSPVFGLTFNAAGTLASSDFRGVRLWNVRTRSQIARVVYPGRLIFHLALARNGATVAGAADDGTVSMWDTRSGKLLFTSASPGSTTSRTVGFEKDGRLVSLSADGDITVWNGGRPRFGAALPRRVSARSRLLAASPDGRLLVAGGKKGVRFWDLETRKPLTVPRAGATGATALAFSPDGKLLAEAHGREVRLWRAKDLPRLVSAGRARFGGSLDALAFSRDGLLAGGDTDGHVSIWDVRTPGAKPRVVGNGSDVRNDPSERFVYDVAFSADGKLLASGGWDGTLRLWRVRDAAHTTEIGAPDDMQAGDSIRSLAFRPHSRVIAVGSGAGGVSLWDAVGRKELRETTPTGFTAVESVAFTRDGQVLVTAGDDGMLRFWDVRALLPLGYALNGHAGKIRRLALSSEASVLASLGNDGSVKLWPGILWRNDAGLAERICHIVAGGITDVEWETTLRRVSPVTANQPRPRLCGT